MKVFRHSMDHEQAVCSCRGTYLAGVIQSSIFWGYAATQIIGGFLATRYGLKLSKRCLWRHARDCYLKASGIWPGGKRVLLFAVTLWSCATMLAPLAANVSTQARSLAC